MISNEIFKNLVIKYTKILSSDQICLEEIKQISNEKLHLLKNNYELEQDRKIQPVNFLRLIIVNQLLQNKDKLTLEFIEEAKENIKNHQMSQYPNIKSEWIENLKTHEKKNYFKTFKKLGRICYRLFYIGEEKEDVINFLNNYVENIKPIIGENVSENIVDFNGSSNFGYERCWISFYPSNLDSHRDAIQLFISFTESKIDFGIYKGSDIDIELDKVKQMYSVEYDENSIQTIKQKFSELKSTWLELNEKYSNKRDLMKPSKKYWKCGFGEQEVLKEFISTNRWYVQYDRDDASKGAIEAYERFDSVKIGDEVAIAGYGGKDNIVVHYVGEVKSIEDDILILEKLNRTLYKGKAPRNGKTNYQTTITEIKSEEDIKTIFFGSATNIESNTVAKTNTNLEDIKSHLPYLNMIFYGPPGTGKTRKLEKLIQLFTDKNETLELNLDTIAKLNWWQLIALTAEEINRPFGPSEIYKHRNIALKAELNNNKSYTGTVCGNLQCHTEPTDEIKQSGKFAPFIFTYKDGLYTLKKDWRDIANFTLNLPNENSRYEFITFHQSYSYEDFIEGIRPILNESEDNSISYEKSVGKFLEICNKARINKDMPHAIFIDEINRGNISQIFGELITLIEESKREETYCDLTYTKDEPFTVPKNLYIIGTMNTADKSIAPLDFALRRRFHFKAFWPDVNEIKTHFGVPEIDTELFCRYFSEFNEKIEILKGKDYTLGHAYFMYVQSKEELYHKFYDQIIPLMQEYFYEDHEALQFLFTANFYKKDKLVEKYKNVPETRKEIFKFCDFKENETINYQKFIDAIINSITNNETNEEKEAA